jgi:APA family basic amino acid/polyamine antiporter
MEIKAKLTTFDTTMIVVSLVIGIGIFRTPAMVASSTQIPSLFFTAWILGGFISLMGALTFAEIGSRFSKPGAYYRVVADCYHSSLAFMFNWTGNLVVQGAGGAAVAIIGAEYIVPIILPEQLQTQLAIQFTAVGMVIILFIINVLGIKTGAWAQNILTIIKVGMILFIVATAFFFKQDVPQQLPQTSLSNSFLTALGIGLISVFYTYGGYQTTINFGADVRKANRNMPRAIFWGIFIIISCYLLINFAYYNVLGMAGIAGAKLVAAEIAKVCFGKIGFLFISLIIFSSALGFVNVTLLQVPRAFYAMANDKTFPAIFMRVNDKTQVQEFTLTFFVGFILLSIFLLGTFEKMVNYIMFLDSLNIAVVASTIFILRHRAIGNGSYSGYQVPFFPILPALFVLFLLGISINVLLTQTREALIGLLFFIAGFPIFLMMRRLLDKENSSR